MIEEKQSRGRPATNKAMTQAQRQRASRAARKQETFDTFAPIQISLMLSAEAAKALHMLTYNRDLSQKKIIEELLIEAYRNNKRDTSH